MGIRVFAITMLVVAAGIVAVPRISGQMICGGNFSAIQRQCERYYEPGGEMTPPSQACCNALRGVDVACMCRLAGYFQSSFSGEKAVYVLRSCGIQVPAGTRCGNYTAPPAPPPPPPQV